MSLVLTGSQVMQVLDMDLALASAEEAFRAYGEGRVNMPPKAYLTLAQGDFRAMYGEIFLARDHICGLKWVNVHPGNPARGLLTVMAKIILNDPDTGLEFADLDGTHITDYRTGAAGGVAARYLARSDATRLGLIGAGAQARTQVAAIIKVRSIREIVVFDRHREHSRGLCGRSGGGLWGGSPGRHRRPSRGGDRSGHRGYHHPQPDPGGGPGVGVAGDPYQRHRRGCRRQTGVGPGDSHRRQGSGGRLGPGVALRGDQRGPGPEGELTPEQIYGSLGEIVAGKKPGREAPEEITVFDSTGLIIQDLALGLAVYQRAQERGLGEEKDFLK